MRATTGLILAGLLFVSTMAPAGRAAAAGPAPGSDDAVNLGRALVITGAVVQAGGVGFSFAGILSEEVMVSIPRIIYHSSTVPFSLMMVGGFEHLLDDGSAGSKQRAISAGLLEGAAYCGMVVGLTGIGVAVSQTSGGGPSEGIDIGAIFGLGYIVTHAITGTVFLAAGLATLASSRTMRVSTTQLMITPWGDGEARGVALVGRF